MRRDRPTVPIRPASRSHPTTRGSEPPDPATPVDPSRSSVRRGRAGPPQVGCRGGAARPPGLCRNGDPARRDPRPRQPTVRHARDGGRTHRRSRAATTPAPAGEPRPVAGRPHARPVGSGASASPGGPGDRPPPPPIPCSSAPGTSPTARWMAGPPPPRSSTGSRARSSPPATTSTRTAARTASATATVRAGDGTSGAPGRRPATTTGRRGTWRATSATSAPRRRRTGRAGIRTTSGRGT